MKREALLKKSSETLEKEMLVHQVQQDKLQLESDLLATQRELGLAKQELLRLKSAQTLSPTNIIKKMDEVAGYEAGIKALEQLKEELF